jgi:tetratricopeptide (TPR) repeat protein
LHLLPAAQAYRRTLLTDPQNPAALLGLSLIARQSGQLQPALHMAQAALAAQQDSEHGSALAWANFGDIVLALGQIEPAETAFRRALRLDPATAAAHSGLGNTLALRENFEAALASYQAAVRLSPHLAEAHFALAFTLGKLARHAEAIVAYKRAIELCPHFAAAWLNLGVALIAEGSAPLAAPCYHQALTVPGSQLPTQISAHLNLGNLHRTLRRFALAQHHYESALVLAQAVPSRLTEIHVSFACLHLERHQFPQAWQSLRAARSTDLSQQNPEIPNTRGILLLAEESALAASRVPPVRILEPESNTDPTTLLEEALQSFSEAECLGHKTAPSNRGNTLLRLGRVQEALAAHQLAVDRDPYHAGARYNLALTQLRLGDFVHGWPNYEARWHFRDVHPHPRRFPQPRWQGESLPPGSTLLIYSEQGLGDTIQFARYLPFVLSRSPNTLILFEVQPQLTRLITPSTARWMETCPPERSDGAGATICHPERCEGPASPGCVRLHPHGQPLPPFTHHIPLLSLPALFETTIDTVPADIPYLHPDPDLISQRASQLGAPHPTPQAGERCGIECKPDHRLTVGLNWAGNPHYRADHERSTTLQTFLPLLELSGIRWISLQHGPAADQINQIPESLRPLDLSSQDKDLADTAALIHHLDLVLTTDTAIAHLAGALGKPLWLLLPWQSDWRWMQDTPTAPWYPTARLFRQSTAGNWPELIQRVGQELQRL